MEELKSKEKLAEIIEFNKDSIISLNASYVEDGEGIKGFSSVGLVPVIQLHSDTKNIKNLFYVALGKAIEKAKAANSNSIFVMCNNPDLASQLEKREGFKELGFKILTKEV